MTEPTAQPGPLWVIDQNLGGGSYVQLHQATTQEAHDSALQRLKEEGNTNLRARKVER